MLKKLTAIGVFVVALAPSVYLAWTLRAMPHFGFYHDDSIYWVAGKSIADGDGYRIASLPRQPYETKYPPLYPALLAGIWKIDPHFPANLELATLFAWLLFPLYVGMVWLVFREYGLEWRTQLALVAIAASSPIAAMFSFSLMPELLFVTLFLASVLAAEWAIQKSDRAWLALFAGAFGGLAYLTKSSALPLLVTAPLYFAFRRKWKIAAFFAAGMAPAVVGWQWWAAQHVSRSWDLVTLYYTNYLGFQIYNVGWRDLPLVVWNNVDGLIRGIGKLLTFDVMFEWKPLERVVAAAAITGAVRLSRRTQKYQYLAAAAGFSMVLLVWHYVPDQRFVFPLYPLLLAGLWTELARVVEALRKAWNKGVGDRAVAVAVGGVLAAFALFVGFTSVYGLFGFLPDLLRSYGVALETRKPAYEWLAQHTPRDANVYAYDDPLVYLYAGRKACNLPIPPKLYYHHDDAGIDRLLHSMPEFAGEYRLQYLVLTPDDFYRDLHEQGARHLAEGVERSGAFQPVFRAPGAVTVYRFTGAESATDRLTAAR